MKTVAIVGMAPTTCHLVAHEQPGIEVWGLNQGHALFTSEVNSKFTRWFQIHPWEEMVACQDPGQGHLEFLQSTKLPVYLQEENPEGCPTGIRYPYEEVCEEIGGNYLTSAVAFMFGLALYEGFEYIKLFGIDMADNTEYREQRPCLEYLIGLALGRGVKVWLPQGCPMLRNALYARSVYVTEKMLRQRLDVWRANQMGATTGYDYFKHQGMVQEVEELIEVAHG